MLYRNVKTGAVIKTYGRVISPDWEEVKTKKGAGETSAKRGTKNGRVCNNR